MGWCIQQIWDFVASEDLAAASRARQAAATAVTTIATPTAPATSAPAAQQSANKRSVKVESGGDKVAKPAPEDDIFVRFQTMYHKHPYALPVRMAVALFVFFQVVTTVPQFWGHSNQMAYYLSNPSIILVAQGEVLYS